MWMVLHNNTRVIDVLIVLLIALVNTNINATRLTEQPPRFLEDAELEIESGLEPEIVKLHRKKVHNRHKSRPVTPQEPVHLVIPLPLDDDFSNGKNPFLISIPKVQPLVDLAMERVYRSGLVPQDSIKIIYRNSNLSDAFGPNVAVQQLLKKEIDCIIGYAYGYALAPVARMSPFWNNGIPVITPIGLTMSLDDKREYQLMTRINSPYKVVSRAVSHLFMRQKWKRHLFMFHHAKSPTVAVGECFLLMASIQHPLREIIEMQHNFYTFNEENHQYMKPEERRKEFKENLMRSSFVANGTPEFYFILTGTENH